jgi:acyl-CoA thioesterase-2
VQHGIAAVSNLDLRETLKLERLEVNLFRGTSPREGAHQHRIYGGQVIAQALLAAYETVEDRICHSLHCYFIHPGDPAVPIIFDVDRARDGRSFTTRRVIAIQHGRQIFNLACSFQNEEPGLDHQFPMPEAPTPEGLPTLRDVIRDRIDEDPSALPEDHPVEMRLVEVEQPGEAGPPRQQAWFRLRVPVGGETHWQQAALAYASDLALLSASTRPHPVSFGSPELQVASLDHAMWFHRPTDLSRWHLYDIDSPSASGARGFNRGLIYREDGTLVCSAAQEGLIRLRRPK